MDSSGAGWAGVNWDELGWGKLGWAGANWDELGWGHGVDGCTAL